MAKQPVTIIILNYNGLRHLKQCLSHARQIRYGGKLELIVVDNASSDGSLSYLKKLGSKIKVIQNKTNLGFAAAYNLAVPQARYELVCMLNNDISVTPGFLSPLVHELTADSKLAMVIPKLRDATNRQLLGGAGMVCDVFGLAFNRGIDEPDHGQHDSDLYLPYACAAAVLFRKSLFRRAGGYDDRYFMYHEDVDLCWRCRLMGYQIKYVPSSAIYHRHMATMSRQSRDTFIYYWERNRFCSLLKNYSFLMLTLILPQLLVLKLLHLGYALCLGRPGEAWQILKAYAWNLANIRCTLANRRAAQRLRVVSDWQIIKLFKKSSIEIRLACGIVKHPMADG
jgi:GT2 family glycosyltransferase